MEKIIDYHVSETRYVASAIRDGWQPWGSAFSADGRNWQPLVRYAEDPVAPAPVNGDTDCLKCPYPVKKKQLTYF